MAVYRSRVVEMHPTVLRTPQPLKKKKKRERQFQLPDVTRLGKLDGLMSKRYCLCGEERRGEREGEKKQSR